MRHHSFLLICAVVTLGFGLSVAQLGSFSGSSQPQLGQLSENVPDVQEDRIRDAVDNSNASLPSRFLRRRISFFSNIEERSAAWRVETFLRSRITGNTIVVNKWFSFKAAPLPRLLVRKLVSVWTQPQDAENVSVPQGTIEFVQAYTGILEYNDKNPRPGFQAGEDTSVNFTSLTGPRALWDIGQVQNYTDSITGNVVSRFEICRADQTLCFVLWGANGTYYRNDTLSYPDEIAVDITINPQKLVPSNALNNIGIIGRTLWKDRTGALEDRIDIVEEAIRAAEFTKKNSVQVGSDLVIAAKDNDDPERGYVNLGRRVVYFVFNATTGQVEKKLGRVAPTRLPELFNDQFGANRNQIASVDKIFEGLDRSRIISYNFLPKLSPALRRFYWNNAIGIDILIRRLDAFNFFFGENDGNFTRRNVSDEEKERARNRWMEQNNLNNKLDIRRDRKEDRNGSDSDTRVERKVNAEVNQLQAQYRVTRRERTNSSRSFDSVSFQFKIAPYIRLLVRKLSANAGVNDDNKTIDASHISALLAFTNLVEFNESNEVEGFQPNADGFVKLTSLRTLPQQWADWTFTNYTAPNNENVTVYEATICTDGASVAVDLCVTVRLANGLYLNDNRTFSPDAMKFDLKIIGYQPVAAGNFLALVARTFFKAAGAQVTLGENFTTVDKALSKLTPKDKDTPVLSNDIVVKQLNDSEGVIINWVRTVTVVLTNGSSYDVRIATTSVDFFANDSFSLTDELKSADVSFGWFQSSRIYFFTFLTPLRSDIDRFVWDPEMGVTPVAATSAGAGSTPTTTGSNAAAAISYEMAFIIMLIAFIFQILMN